MKNIVNLILAFFALQIVAAQEPNNDVYINFGGPAAYKDNATFKGDADFPSYYNSSSTYSIGNAQVEIPESIFHSERYSPTLAGTLVYNIPVDDGTYTVKTYHNELFFGVHPDELIAEARDRVFKIKAEGGYSIIDSGNTVPEELDLFVVNGNNPYIHDLGNITVVGDVLNLEFVASVQNSQVSAISIEGPNGNHYINVGSTDDVDFNGNTFKGDGNLGYNASQTYSIIDASVSDLFNTERFGTGEYLSYGIPVPNGTYTVKTHHNELWFGKAGPAVTYDSIQRAFDVVVENAPPVLDVELKVVSSNGPHTIVFNSVLVTDGILDIDLKTKVVGENATISGISIVGIGEEIYINAGGAVSVDYDDGLGLKTYKPEGEALIVNNAHTSNYTTLKPINQMFNTERFGSAIGGVINYTIPVVANKTYTVQTHHKEQWFGIHPTDSVASVGDRVFDVVVEGTTLETNLDLFVQNGNMPYSTYAEGIVASSDGILNIDLAGSTQKSQLSGITIIGTDTGDDTEIYINVGSDQDYTYLGNLYLGDQDQGYTTSGTYTNTAASTETLFKTDRYGSNGALSYGIPVPNGTYTVKTHHNELWFGYAGGTATAGLRVFDVTIEDSFTANVDLFNASNNGPYTVVSTPVMVGDNILDIDLTASVNNPTISGITIIGTNGTEIYIKTGGTGDVTYDDGNGSKTYLAEKKVLVSNNVPNNMEGSDPVVPELHESERYAAGTSDLDISVPIDNGVYTVKTYHNEIFYGVYPTADLPAVGQRVYDISLEGNLKQNDFDLYAYNNQEIVPTILTFDNIEVTDGQLDLKLGRIAGKNNPSINGLSIIKTGDVGPIEEEGDETPVAYNGGIIKSNENYVFTRSYQAPMGTFSPTNEADVMESIIYFDGLGRSKQSVQLKVSQDEKDIVTHIGYDDFGRMEKEWLPHEGNTAHGTFRTTAENNTNTYYQAHYGDDLDATPNPFSQKEFEASPLSRVLKQAAPGKDWKLGSGHEIHFGYETNEATDVRLFNVTFNNGDTEDPQLSGGSAYYAAGELYKNVTKDENWSSGTDHTTEEYTDKQGRVVLKRMYNVTAHDTYYVYDDYGNLTYVLPPKVDTTDGVSSTELSELCYQYKYDHRNRLIEKKIPVKGTATDWESIVYNKLDQPIMTQDPNLKADGKWLFTKYDIFGRVAFTGMLSSSASRTTIQTAADSYSDVHWVTQGGSNLLASTTIYYDNKGYPTTGFDQLHTISYYGDYNNTRDGIAQPTGLIQGQALATNTKGLPTVGKVRVLDKPDWITTLMAYDKKGRVIYSQSENLYHGSVDIIKTKLDFAGKVLTTETSHQKDGGTSLVTLDKFDYDHANRLLKQRQELQGKTEMIVHNTFDGTGQLVDKKVGNTKVNSLQDVSYNYNIRGWLKNINEGVTQGNDLFGFEIRYNDPTNFSGNENPDALFNGNISQTFWKTQSVNNTANPVSERYSYNYDALNRITAAFDNTNNYTLSNVEYDINGNITKLARRGAVNETSTSFNSMDNLTYIYDNGNKLTRIDEINSVTYGFKSVTSGTADQYSYDDNGNMISDANKGITSITYNHLDLPTQVTFASGNIQYVYSADGTKLRKIVSSGNTSDYSGNYIYENDVLQFFGHDEGYVTPDGNGGFDYVYRFVDHLNNIRLSYTDADGNGSIDPSNEIIKESNYYPFGLSHKGYNSNVSSLGNSVAKRYMFGGKEFNDELGLDWYDITARNYDPAIGRWMNLDPLAEQMRRHSPYNYAFNNPIFFMDPDGMMPCPPGEDCPGFFEMFTNDLNELGDNFHEGFRNFMSNPPKFAGDALLNAGNGFATLVADVTNISGIMGRENQTANAIKAGAEKVADIPNMSSGELGSLAADVVKVGVEIAVTKKLSVKGVSNPVPDRLARVVPGNLNPKTLGAPGATDVFVTAASDIKGLNASLIAKKLTIPESSSGFNIIEFDTPKFGISTPINRTNPGFVGGGKTAGGAREFALPNLKISKLKGVKLDSRL